MKQLLTILFIMVMSIAAAAQAPYTGGSGSGYTAVPTAATACSFYVGGNGDGADMSTTPALACPSFFGGIADGAASNTSPVTICPPFFGGLGDGYSSQSGGCLIVLPLRRINFYGEKETDRNLLHWTLSDGFQPQTIDIEKSANGNSYKKVGSLPGNTNPAYTYHFTDTDLYPELNYYRLRITERNNAITYSQVLVMKSGVNSFMSLYPNPASGSATLFYQAPQASITRLLIYQYDGRLVRTQPVQLVRGANYITVNLQGLAAGLYIISVNDERVRVVVE
jgi:hypothetical protein